MLQLSDLSSDQEATGSSSHGGGGDIATSYAALSPLLAPPAAAAGGSAMPPPPPPPRQPQEGSRAQQGTKRKRSQPGNPDPGAEVIALSPRTLVATNRFVCEICNKGFQRDQNLQLHRRGHNLPWKLRQRNLPAAGGGAGRQGGGGEAAAPRKRVYVCPEPSCVHHDPGRALGDLTGIKKHFSRKHGEKRWQCERCGKRYAVHSDWKAHVKGCGTREYRCDCGILFARKDSLLTHRAFCDALAEESARLLAAANNSSTIDDSNGNCNSNLLISSSSIVSTPLFLPYSNPPPAAQNPNNNAALFFLRQEDYSLLQPINQPSPPYLDHLHGGAAAAVSTNTSSVTCGGADKISFGLAPDGSVAMRAAGHCLTRDFLGVDDAGEVEVLEELQLPLCSTAAAAAVPRTACCATDLTRQYLGGRLPPVSETWSHNF
ncbi:hypothetical protein ACP4OV_011075 [Aristida adscensionis]